MTEFAAELGVSRETLSRIEHGFRWPSYPTIYKIMGLLGIEWETIAVRGTNVAPALIYASDNRQDLGDALRNGRIKERKSLQVVADVVGLSVSQLSRIERSQSTRGRLIESIGGKLWQSDDDRFEFSFTHPELNRLAKKGRM